MSSVGNIRPIGDRILLSPLKKIEHILTPQNTPDKGVVVGVGDGRVDESGNSVPLPVNIGDIVYYNKDLSAHVQLGRENFVCVSWDGVEFIESQTFRSFTEKKEVTTPKIIVTSCETLPDGSVVEKKILERSGGVTTYRIYHFSE